MRVDPAGRTRLAHLHLMAPGEPRWDDQVCFRDRLRTEPDLRTDYAALEQRAAVAHHDDREAYGETKRAFVIRVVGG